MSVPELHGLSVLVTGGGSGIGAGIVRYFAAAGARVTFCGRRGSRLDDVAAELGEEVCPVVADVTDQDDRRRVVNAAVEHGGGIDVLVHAAANMYRGSVSELEETELLEIYRSNTAAPVLLTGLSLPELKRSQGSVVFFGSVHTVRAFPGALPYAATKGALETITGVLAAELGSYGVRVNCVRPGGVHTELNQRAAVVDETESAARLQRLAAAHALGRIGSDTEVAQAVAYLATAEWTTGSVLTVDGGLGLGVTNE